jgi:hypothetical protein
MLFLTIFLNTCIFVYNLYKYFPLLEVFLRGRLIN